MKTAHQILLEVEAEFTTEEIAEALYYEANHYDHIGQPELAADLRAMAKDHERTE